MLNQTSTSQNNHSARGQMAFLRRVTEDDRFRSALEADAQAALAEFGLSVDSEQIPSKVEIPSPESVLDVLIDAEDSDPESAREAFWYGFIAS